LSFSVFFHPSIHLPLDHPFHRVPSGFHYRILCGIHFLALPLRFKTNVTTFLQLLENILLYNHIRFNGVIKKLCFLGSLNGIPQKSISPASVFSVHVFALHNSILGTEGWYIKFWFYSECSSPTK
jgi:hypothetical protein